MSYTLDISTKNNPEQAELARLIHERQKRIIYCEGRAGTGKTLITLAASLQLVLDKKYKKILYVRSPMEVGSHSIGFLPGEVSDKISPYGGALEDNLSEISRICHLNAENLKQKIEVTCPQFMRGRSFNNGYIIICDESQNLSRIEIKTLLTRIGEYSKIILLGDTQQIDAKGMTKDNNEFMKTYEILSDYNFVGHVELIKSERSEMCAIIDDLL